ncbi:MAG: hypothetical protein LBK05_01480 [Treponema sp.]|nr:hypothetical protein [Treponema sp.]
MTKTILPVLFCIFFASTAFGQNLVEPNWGQFIGAPPEEVAELSEDFGLSFAELQAIKPNLKAVGAAGRNQYRESTTYRVNGNDVTMTAIYYIDSKLGYYAATLEIESSYAALINRQFSDWEILVSDTLGWGSPSITTMEPSKSLRWQQRNQWPAIIISQPPRSGNRYRVSYSQYSQLGITRGDPVSHRELVQQATRTFSGGVRQ